MTQPVPYDTIYMRLSIYLVPGPCITRRNRKMKQIKMNKGKLKRAARSAAVCCAVAAVGIAPASAFASSGAPSVNGSAGGVYGSLDRQHWYNICSTYHNWYPETDRPTHPSAGSGSGLVHRPFNGNSCPWNWGGSGGNAGGSGNSGNSNGSGNSGNINGSGSGSGAGSDSDAGNTGGNGSSDSGSAGNNGNNGSNGSASKPSEGGSSDNNGQTSTAP